MNKKIIVIGGSAGSLDHIIFLLSKLKNNVSVPIVIVIHLQEKTESIINVVLSKKADCKINFPEEFEKIENNRIYIAPPIYHLQVEPDFTFSFSLDDRVHYSRPSIDVLFETVARAYKSDATVVLLSGASKDGANGVGFVEKYGGTVLIQDPKEAESETMVNAGIKNTKDSKVLTVKEILKHLIREMKI